MTPTSFWLIRHALVEENARAIVYGTLDVEVCPHTMDSARPTYAQLAAHLPRPATWLVSPLSRTRRTAEAIFANGHDPMPLTVEPGLIEADFGTWQGLPHADVAAQLTEQPHAFWPLSGQERPPGGESIADVILRVGATMERLARTHEGQDVVAVSHGGAIRAAVAHALDAGAETALHFSVENLSLTRLERHARGWKVVCVNSLPGV